MSERRQGDRARIALLATIHTDAYEYSCRALDLSAGGMKIEFDEEGIEVGEEIAVDFELPDSDRTLLLKGTVVHTEGGTMGIEFKRVKLGYRKAIERFVEEYGPLS